MRNSYKKNIGYRLKKSVCPLEITFNLFELEMHS